MMTKLDEKEAAFSYKELESGDIGVSYKPKRNSFSTITNYYTLSFIFLGVTVYLMNLFEPIWRPLIILLPLSFFVYAYKKNNVIAINRKREKIGILSLFDENKITSLCKGIFDEDANCLYRKYIVRQTKDLGIFERLVVAYLSNDKFVVFKVVNRTNEKDKWSLTIRKTPSEIQDEFIAFQLLPFGIWVKRYFNPENNCFVAFLQYLLLWTFLVVVIIVPAYFYPIEWNIAVWSYAILGHLVLKMVKPEKLPRWLFYSIILPGKTFNLLLNLTGPILLFFFGAFIILIIGTLIACVLYGLSWLAMSGSLGVNLKYMVFLMVASLSISSVYVNNFIRSVFERMDILRDMEDKSLESPMLGFVEYIYQKENINCLIYMAYLFFIGISTTHQYLMDSSPYLVSEGVDSAVTKAFLIHIAFTNVVARWKETILKTEGVIHYIDRMYKV